MKTRTIMALMLAIFASGCVQLTSIPSSARPGDYVVLGLGGIHRNAKSNYRLDLSDITVTITDSATNTFPLYKHSSFRAYPDYSSSLTQNALVNGMGRELVPYDGGWFLVAKLSDSSFNPLALAEGRASISVTSSSQLDNLNLSEGNLTSIEIDILPPYPAGQLPNSNFHQQFFHYAPSENLFAVRINPDDLTNVNGPLGGASILVNYSVADDAGMEIIAVPVSHNPWIQIGSQFHSNGDGTGYVRVFILNAHGFEASPGRQSAHLTDLQVHFLPLGGNVSGSTYQLDATESYVFDIDGDVVNGLDLEYVEAGDL